MRKALKVLIILVLVFSLLNISVSTRQGINYHVQTVKIPLYLKLLDFFERHYNYGPLAKRITQGARSKEERVMKLLEWTHQNIRRIPGGFPVVDDHAWNIIIRGYGAYDQSADVFSTLCNYAGIEAFYILIPSAGGSKLPISFVKLNGRWAAFDSYYGVYFRDKEGRLADVVALKSGHWLMERTGDTTEKVDTNYALYFPNLPAPEQIGLSKAKIQSPFNRLLFEVKKICSLRHRK